MCRKCASRIFDTSHSIRRAPQARASDPDGNQTDSTNERAKGTLMIDYDPFEEFRDPQTYDLEDEGYYDDYPLTEQWARSLGGPLLDLACGTGRMALRMAEL